jgi:predicted Rossmann fold nucleotide-binding protein DprA/Smf involved in DNA uptake
MEVIARSPAMEAADTARQLGRPVFVVPPDERSGPHTTDAAQLLDSGQAQPVRDAGGILTALP